MSLPSVKSLLAFLSTLHSSDLDLRQISCLLKVAFRLIFRRLRRFLSATPQQVSRRTWGTFLTVQCSKRVDSNTLLRIRKNHRRHRRRRPQSQSQRASSQNHRASYQRQHRSVVDRTCEFGMEMATIVQTSAAQTLPRRSSVASQWSQGCPAFCDLEGALTPQ